MGGRAASYPPLTPAANQGKMGGNSHKTAALNADTLLDAVLPAGWDRCPERSALGEAGQGACPGAAGAGLEELRSWGSSAGISSFPFFLGTGW